MSDRRREEPGELDDPSPFPAAYGPVGEADSWRSSRHRSTGPVVPAAALPGMEPVWPAIPPIDPPPEEQDRYPATAPGGEPPTLANTVLPREGRDEPTSGTRLLAGWPAGGRPRFRNRRREDDDGWGEPAGASPAGIGVPAVAGVPVTGASPGSAAAAATAAEPLTTTFAASAAPEPEPVTGAVPSLPPGWEFDEQHLAAGGRRIVRHLVRRIDAWTVFKVSLVFYLLMLVIVLIAGIVAWEVAAGLNFIADIEKLVRGLAVDRKFVLHGRAVLEYAAAAGAVLALVGTFINTIAALLYNLISDLFGGVQTVTVAQDDLDED